VGWESCKRAVRAMWRCARVGGLKEESSMYRVFGDCGCFVSGREVRTWKLEVEEVKDVSAEA